MRTTVKIILRNRQVLSDDLIKSISDKRHVKYKKIGFLISNYLNFYN